MAATYHVATDGSEEYRTLAEVQGKAGGYIAGDEVLLRRGDSWAENLEFPSSGVSGNPIIIGAYGTGSLPVIQRLGITGLSFIDISDIQTTSASVGARIGLRIQYSHDINIDRAVCDSDGKSMYAMQLVGNSTGPVYSYNVYFRNCVFKNSIAGANPELVAIGNYAHDITIENCEAFDGGYNALDCGSPTYGYTFNINFIGNYIHDCIGWGINFGYESHNSLAERNYIIGHSGIIADRDSHDNIIRNNIIILNDDTTANNIGVNLSQGAENYKVFNNTVMFITTQTGEPLYLASTSGVGNIVKNNILYSTRNNGGLIYLSGDTISHITLDNNLYINTVGSAYDFYVNTVYYASLEDWQSATGQDSDSVWGDPQLNQFHRPLKSSPCIDSGINLQEVTSDYVGTPRPLGRGTDIGAYEFYKAKVNNATLKDAEI